MPCRNAWELFSSSPTPTNPGKQIHHATRTVMLRRFHLVLIFAISNHGLITNGQLFAWTYAAKLYSQGPPALQNKPHTSSEDVLLSGKRIHLALPVRWSHAGQEGRGGAEMACTYDIHPHGARLLGARQV